MVQQAQAAAQRIRRMVQRLLKVLIAAGKELSVGLAIVAKLQISDLMVALAEIAWKRWRRKEPTKRLP